MFFAFIEYMNIEDKCDINETETIQMCATRAMAISPENGMIVKFLPCYMSTFPLYYGRNGDELILENSNYEFGVATYALTVDSRYIYTYCYQQEENWATYNCDFADSTFGTNSYIFEKECYFRVCLRRRDRKEIMREESDQLNEILKLRKRKEKEQQERVIFTDEIKEISASILKKNKEMSLTLAVLADNHYTVGGTWSDTAQNIRLVHRNVKFDGIVHLGDLTDGMIPKKITKEYVRIVVNSLLDNQIPLYIVQGNHDSNYFSDNKEPLTDEEQYQLYQKHCDPYVVRDGHKLWYYVNYEELAIRLICLSSFDYREPVKYGFSEEELEWLKCILNHDSEKEYLTLVFSHVPPLADIHYWSDEIRNSEKLIKILEDYRTNTVNKGVVYFHGHNHADQIYNKQSFPIISIGCSKCEYFQDKKPAGSVTQYRRLGTVSQELWDTLIIKPEKRRIEIVRFGAGEDRIISY